MICAYAGSLFITERLFVVLKPKLLTLPCCGCLAMVGGRSRQVRLPAPPNVDATATKCASRPRGNTEAGFSVG
jgi:hypothetical protein